MILIVNMNIVWNVSNTEFIYLKLDPGVQLNRKHFLPPWLKKKNPKTHFIGKHYLLPTYPLLKTLKSSRGLICRVLFIWGSKCLSDHHNIIMCKLTIGIGYVHSIPGSFSWQHLSKMWLPTLEIGVAHFCSITEIVPS